jgi:peptidylprolyl isomerase
MEKVSEGLFVSVDYKGTLANGNIFDTSEGRQPLEIQIGAGQLLQGFENALLGMSLNETKTFTLDPEDAYGLVEEDRKRTFPQSEVPAEMNAQVGQTVALTTPDGRQIPARIIAVNAEGVTVDLNHPLAGEALTFEIEIVGISESATQAAGCGCDCSSGKAKGGCGAEDKSGCGCH